MQTMSDWQSVTVERRAAVVRALTDLTAALRSRPDLASMADAQLVRSMFGSPDHSVSEGELADAPTQFLAPINQASSQMSAALSQLARQAEHSAARHVRADGGVMLADVPPHAVRIVSDDEMGVVVLAGIGGVMRCLGPVARERGPVSGEYQPRPWYSAASVERWSARWRVRQQALEAERQERASDAQAERTRRLDASSSDTPEQRELRTLRARVATLERRGDE